MGRVVKAVAIIAVAVAVAYFAPQLSAALVSAGLTATTAAAITSAAVSTAIAAGLAAGASLLAGRPTTNATPGIFRQSVSNSFIVYGKRRVGGLMVFFHPLFGGKFHYRFFVIAVAGHRCKGVVRWFLNDEQVSVNSAGLVTSGPYAGNAWLWFGRGTDAQEAPSTFLTDTGGKWSSAHVGKGVAKIFAKFQMTDDVVQAGMPNITAEIEGKDDILDPRTEERGYTRNAILVFYDWLSMPREEGGFGAYPDEVDWDWVAAQANVCDEPIPLRAGGTEPRYEFDSYIETGAAPSEIRDTFVTCCAGSFTYAGGKMLLRPGYYVPPSATLLESDLAGPITIPALLADDETATEVSAKYVDPAFYQPKDAPSRSVAASDVRQRPIDLPHITSGARAQRIAEIILRKARAERRVQWPMNIAGIAISTLETVQLATVRYNLSNYSFQVVGWGLSQDFGVNLSLEEHDPEIYEWNASWELLPGEVGELDRATPIEPVGSEVEQLLIANSYPVNISIISADAGGSASITVSNHSRVYQDRTVAITGTTLTGLLNSTAYYLYYDDADREGIDVVIMATTVYADAFTGAAHPARHYVGSIVSASTGGGDTGGGGGSPPGGGGQLQNPNIVEQ